MNDACASRAPPLTTDAKPSGTYETLDNGMRCYKVGPSDATRAVMFGYDALGFTQPQLLGADLISARLSALVFVPDFFRGEALDPTVFSLPAEERAAGVKKFTTGPGNIDQGVANAGTLVAELRKKYPRVTAFGWQGFCWGGKVGILSSAAGTPFAVSAACHPGRLDVADVAKLTIPHICLLSGEDGTDEEARAYADALKESGQDVYYDRFEGSVHGWMSARADLKDEKAVKEYERGYELVAKFFEKHL